MEIYLDSDKIKKELEKEKRPIAWLAGELGVHRQIIYYALNKRSVSWAGKIGGVLKIDPFKLIVKEDS